MGTVEASVAIETASPAQTEGLTAVDTSLAGLGAGGRRWRGRRTAIPAAFRYTLAVSRRRPSPPECGGAASRAGPTLGLAAACRRPRCWSYRRGDHSSPPPSTSWGAATSLAGFQVSTTGRFWVSTEA